MGLAHTGHNQLADSHSGETTKDAPNDGLSVFGREVIAEMNRVGMMVDLSHLSTDGGDAGDRALEGAGDRVAFRHARARRPQPQSGR